VQKNKKKHSKQTDKRTDTETDKEYTVTENSAVSNAVVSINEVALRPARLLLGSVTAECEQVNRFGIQPTTNVNSAYHPREIGKSSTPTCLAGICLCRAAGNTIGAYSRIVRQHVVTSQVLCPSYMAADTLYSSDTGFHEEL